MKRVLGIIGSPRKMGNCELTVKEIAARLPEASELSMVRLADKDIRPCKACYRCLMGDCPQVDDFGAVISAIVSADGVIVAAPVYLLGAHSSLQRFLDRGLQFWKHLDALAGKPAVGVALAGVRDGEGASLLGVENFMRGMGMEVKGRAVIHAALPGEVLLSEEGMAAAARLAGSLFAPGARQAPSPSCTRCGGTYFEFRGRDRVYCLLCGAGGTVAGEGEGVRIETVAPAHSWRGPDARKAHGEWLIGMKERYLRERDRLKEVSRPYAGGNFI
ncbi:MAG: flavodoxin family protein [Deltaproteobacteria bacterium]|nr:flavodoxin family protein [Deltaproteobacteria bacterium]